MNNETDHIQNAIRHIQTAVDIDPWAAEIAVEAMQKQIPKKKINAGGWNVCPTCGHWPIQSYCNGCGQRIDWTEGE